MRCLGVFVVWIGVVALSSSAAYCTEYHSGDVSGLWTKANSPHVIVAEVRVPPGQSLTIEPGCQVLFQGNYKFVVDNGAVLQAAGSADDSILFDELTQGTGWGGIRFLQADSISVLTYCRLQHGQAIGQGDDSYGGAVYCLSSSPSITSCTLDTNFAVERGGAIYCMNSNPRIEFCQFRKDSAAYLPVACSKGGALYCESSQPTLTGNTFSGNTAVHGAAVYLTLSSPPITDNIFISNHTPEDGGAIECSHANPTLTGNTFTSNRAWSEGGAIHLDFSRDVFISGNSFISNWAGLNGGAIDVPNSTTPTIVANTFLSNSGSYGGAVLLSYTVGGTIADNVFQENGGYYGAALLIDSPWDQALIARNVFLANSGGYGGAICCFDSWTNPQIYSCTFTGNVAGEGGAIACLGAFPEVKNCILWADSAIFGSEIYLEKPANPSVTYCDVQGGWAGEGNLNTDPQFLNPVEDVHFRWSSPCIDAGDPTFPPDPDSTRADLGAYYYDYRWRAKIHELRRDSKPRPPER